MKKTLHTVYSIIGWFLAIFFLVATIAYLPTPLTALCTLICCIMSCPLIKKLSFRLAFGVRSILVLFFFTIGMLAYPNKSETFVSKPSEQEVVETTIPKPSNQETMDVVLNDKETQANILNSDLSKEIIDTEEEISDEEFQIQCKELWHDDIFFSNSISKGNYVKLDLFVEEARFFDTVAAYAWPSSDLITDYDLQKDFFYCGVQREDEYSYVGGQINLFFSNQYECSSSDISVGDHLIVYGEVIEFSTNTADGYNYCSIIPRYIENNGQ